MVAMDSDDTVAVRGEPLALTVIVDPGELTELVLPSTVIEWVFLEVGNHGGTLASFNEACVTVLVPGPNDVQVSLRKSNLLSLLGCYLSLNGLVRSPLGVWHGDMRGSVNHTDQALGLSDRRVATEFLVDVTPGNGSVVELVSDVVLLLVKPEL